MKTILAALFLLTFSSIAGAEVCTSVIRDQRNGYEYEPFTRSSYHQQAACDQAIFDCNGALSYANSQGRYYGAQCELKYIPAPNPYPNPRNYICQTDLVDRWGSVVRTFSAPGSSEWDACSTSDNFCKAELARRDSLGVRCVNRGLIDNRNDPRPPNRTKTEQCTVNRLDPAGMFIQKYLATATGPIHSDVKREACSRALSQCSGDLRGRQTCQIAY